MSCVSFVFVIIFCGHTNRSSSLVNQYLSRNNSLTILIEAQIESLDINIRLSDEIIDKIYHCNVNGDYTLLVKSRSYSN